MREKIVFPVLSGLSSLRVQWDREPPLGTQVSLRLHRASDPTCPMIVTRDPVCLRGLDLVVFCHGQQKASGTRTILLGEFDVKSLVDGDGSEIVESNALSELDALLARARLLELHCNPYDDLRAELFFHGMDVTEWFLVEDGRSFLYPATEAMAK